MSRKIYCLIALMISSPLIFLQGCTSFLNQPSYEQTENYDNYYSQEQDESYTGGQFVPRARHVTVPETYHTSQGRSPTSHKQKDKSWVKTQNPNTYTIEIADDNNPATVAKKLFKAPKDHRMAQIKYDKNGKKHYTGVYGSFKSKEEAQKALEKLPAEVKAKAGIEQWSKVQTKVKEDSGENHSYGVPKASN